MSAVFVETLVSFDCDGVPCGGSNDDDNLAVPSAVFER